MTDRPNANIEKVVRTLRDTNCKNEYDECLVQEICKNATNATA